MHEVDRPAAFVTVELPDSEPDIIVSFAFSREDDPVSVDNFILIRTPAFEPLLPPQDRGVAATYDTSPHMERQRINRIILRDDSAQLFTETHRFAIDLTDVESDDLATMRQAIKQMNFDANFETDGV